MAYIRMYRCKWRAEVERRGMRRSKVFQFRSEAKQWAAAIEAEILASTRLGQSIDGPPHAVAMSAPRQGGAL